MIMVLKINLANPCERKRQGAVLDWQMHSALTTYFRFALLLGLPWTEVLMAQEAAEPPKPAAVSKGRSLLRQIEQGFIEVYESAAPGVVVLECVIARQEEVTPAFDTNADEHWPLPDKNTSQGSGFIVRADGLILTAAHVIAGAKSITVRCKDGKKFPAKLVGTDEAGDVALLQIPATHLQPVQWADSDAAKVGQLVCAIGIPFRQEYSFTCGWLSGKGRLNLLGPTSGRLLYEEYLQTDAPINPGNSGGPLFDVDGHVLGMNVLIHGHHQGLAFAVPSNLLRRIADELLAHGRVRRSWLGVRLLEPKDSSIVGALIETVVAGGPAFQAGLLAEDVVTGLDGVEIFSVRDLQQQVSRKPIGHTCALAVLRKGVKQTIQVTTGELNAQATSTAPEKPEIPVPLRTVFGLRAVNPAPGETGASVREVLPESPASVAGLREGDVVRSVDGKVVKDAETMRNLLIGAAHEGRDNVLVEWERSGERLSAQMKLGRADRR